MIVEQTNTPVPTPTPRPTWAWATPTMHPTQSPDDPYAIDGFTFQTGMVDGTESVVGVWQTANISGAMDMVQGLLMFIIVLRLTRRILNEWRTL